MLLHKLVDLVNTVLIIKSEINGLSYVNNIIELGSEGGSDGGGIIATGFLLEVKGAQKLQEESR